MLKLNSRKPDEDFIFSIVIKNIYTRWKKYAKQHLFSKK